MLKLRSWIRRQGDVVADVRLTHVIRGRRRRQRQHREDAAQRWRHSDVICPEHVLFAEKSEFKILDELE